MAIRKLGTPDNVSKNPKFDGTGSMFIPVGTTMAQRHRLEQKTVK